MTRVLGDGLAFPYATGAGSVGVCSEREDGPVNPNCGGAELSVPYRPKATTLGKIGGWRAGRVIRKRASVQHWLEKTQETFDSQAAIITPTPRIMSLLETLLHTCWPTNRQRTEYG